MPRSLTLITGGTRGIGAATATRLATDGHDLVLGYAHDDETATACRRNVEELGVRCLVVRSDVSTEHGVESLFERARSFGRLTGVVNNAGATAHLGRWPRHHQTSSSAPWTSTSSAPCWSHARQSER